MSTCQPGTSVDAGNFRFTFIGTTDLIGGIVLWCWNITFIGESGPALNHWDIQTCPALGLAQIRRLIIQDVTSAPPPVVLLNTTDPIVIDQFIDFSANFPDGFPVYGMKTDLGALEAELGPGQSWNFCYEFDENQVPLEPIPGFVAPKSGAGQAIDALAFGLCVPGCAGPAVAPRRGYRL